MGKNDIDLISDELLAAYLDGNTTLAETQLILHELGRNAELREVLNIAVGADNHYQPATTLKKIHQPRRTFASSKAVFKLKDNRLRQKKKL